MLKVSWGVAGRKIFKLGFDGGFHAARELVDGVFQSVDGANFDGQGLDGCLKVSYCREQCCIKSLCRRGAVGRF